MNLSVIIVNWNTRELLAQCLASVVSDLPSIEVYVVDNASVDGSAQMVSRQFPSVHLVENAENVGFAVANNQAILRAKGHYVMLLNSDTQVHDGALETMIKFMDDHPRAGACGPLLLNADGTLQVSCHPMLTPWREFWRLLFLDQLWRRATYDMPSWDMKRSRDVEVIKGACFVLRREALDQVGLLDQRYFMYTEEVDLCYRLRRAGWRLVWIPQACVTHFGGGSTRKLAETMYVELYRSKVQFFRKFGGEAYARLFKILVASAYLPRLIFATIGVLFSRKLTPQAHTFRRLLTEISGM